MMESMHIIHKLVLPMKSAEKSNQETILTLKILTTYMNDYIKRISVYEITL